MQCQTSHPQYPITAALARVGRPLTECQLRDAVSADFQDESHFHIALQNHIRAGHVVPEFTAGEPTSVYGLIDWSAAPAPEQTPLERVQRIVQHWGMEPH